MVRAWGRCSSRILHDEVQVAGPVSVRCIESRGAAASQNRRHTSCLKGRAHFERNVLQSASRGDAHMDLPDLRGRRRSVATLFCKSPSCNAILSRRFLSSVRAKKRGLIRTRLSRPTRVPATRLACSSVSSEFCTVERLTSSSRASSDE